MSIFSSFASHLSLSQMSSLLSHFHQTKPKPEENRPPKHNKHEHVSTKLVQVIATSQLKGKFSPCPESPSPVCDPWKAVGSRAAAVNEKVTYVYEHHAYTSTTQNELARSLEQYKRNRSMLWRTNDRWIIFAKVRSLGKIVNPCHVFRVEWVIVVFEYLKFHGINNKQYN